MPREKTREKQIRDYLKRINAQVYENTEEGPRFLIGIPFYIQGMKGQIIKFSITAAFNTDKTKSLKKWEKTGAITGVVHTVEEVKFLIQNKVEMIRNAIAPKTKRGH